MGNRVEIYPDAVHHYIDLGDIIIRETFLSDGEMYCFIIDKYGKWVKPLQCDVST